MSYVSPNKRIGLIHAGLIDYQVAWDYQQRLFDRIVDLKMQNRNSNEQHPSPNYLITCEHPPVYTLGKSGDKENLLLDEQQLEALGAKYYAINRGGDITHHGPGQLVVYPILDLENFYTDIHRYLRDLEESVILMLTEFGIRAGRYTGYTGVWIDEDKPEARKICAMGVKCGRWVTMHGIALNVNNDLGFFDHIVPCGIKDKDVTSMQKELGFAPDFEAVRKILLEKMQIVFGWEAFETNEIVS
jgi:lipoyl(octanoyl) transferase